jgi:hypothetical protein
MQVQDLYKLIHQGALGSEHAVANIEAAQAWLVREVSNLGTGPLEETIDPLNPGGEIVRVHLRPYIEDGGDLDCLLKAFVRTANQYRGDPVVLLDAIGQAQELVNAREASFSGAELADFFKAMGAQGFPAIHHSPVYEELYRPAYRVVKRDFLR